MKNVVIGFPVGNTLIGEVKEISEKEIVLVNPVELMAVPVEGGKVQMTMIPFKFIFAESVDSSVTFSKNKCLFIKDLNDFPQMLEGYKSEISKMTPPQPANAAPETKPNIIVE